MSLRKSSSRRKGSKSEVLPKPKARRRCTPAPSRVGLDLIRRFTGRSDMGGLHEMKSRQLGSSYMDEGCDVGDSKVAGAATGPKPGVPFGFVQGRLSTSFG